MRSSNASLSLFCGQFASTSPETSSVSNCFSSWLSCCRLQKDLLPLGQIRLPPITLFVNKMMKSSFTNNKRNQKNQKKKSLIKNNIKHTKQNKTKTKQNKTKQTKQQTLFGGFSEEVCGCCCVGKNKKGVELD